MANPYVVVVDDCPDETFLVSRIIEQHEQDIDLCLLENGAQAIDVLGDPSSRKPDLVILDNKMPFFSGIDVIKSLNRSERFKSVPMVLMSTVLSRRDIEEAYRVGARSCVSKGDDITNWNRQLRSVLAYWLTINEVNS